MSSLITLPKSRAARVLFEAMRGYFEKRHREIRVSMHVHEEVTGVLLSALAGVLAIGIRSGMGSRGDMTSAAMNKLREFLDRELHDA